ncbi:hypothetical protein J6590_013980 [Homalodisca vitripennis]|nr:hypothetical protein J6590_013980 [Homalodisca vitripennis]
MFGVDEPDFYGALDLATGRSYLFAPQFNEDHTIYMGALPSCDELKKKYAVDVVCYVNQRSRSCSGFPSSEPKPEARLPPNSRKFRQWFGGFRQLSRRLVMASRALTLTRSPVSTVSVAVTLVSAQWRNGWHIGAVMSGATGFPVHAAVLFHKLFKVDLTLPGCAHT